LRIGVDGEGTVDLVGVGGDELWVTVANNCDGGGDGKREIDWSDGVDEVAYVCLAAL